MKNLLLSLMFLFPVSGAVAQDKPDESAPEKPQPVEERIRQLIRQLGADAYEVREKAQAALEKIGKPALEALRKALKGADLEVSSRAQELIEKITGKKKRAEPKNAPTNPAEPTIPFNPGDMESMLDKLKEFEGLSPSLKKALDSFRKMLGGTKGNETPGLPDFDKLIEGLEGFLDRGKPELKPAPSPQLKTATEILLGLEVEPVGDVLRAHLNIKDGLVIRHIDPSGRAFKQGLRQYDILTHISTESAPKIPLPGPQKAWDAWRSKALKPSGVTQLERLKAKSFVEVVRKGKSCRIIEMAPLSVKKKGERGF